MFPSGHVVSPEVGLSLLFLHLLFPLSWRPPLPARIPYLLPLFPLLIRAVSPTTHQPRLLPFVLSSLSPLLKVYHFSLSVSCSSLVHLFCFLPFYFAYFLLSLNLLSFFLPFFFSFFFSLSTYKGFELPCLIFIYRS